VEAGELELGLESLANRYGLGKIMESVARMKEEKE
jgi:hypothetical protein